MLSQAEEDAFATLERYGFAIEGGGAAPLYAARHFDNGACIFATGKGGGGTLPTNSDFWLCVYRDAELAGCGEGMAWDVDSDRERNIGGACLKAVSAAQAL